VRRSAVAASARAERSVTFPCNARDASCQEPRPFDSIGLDFLILIQIFQFKSEKNQREAVAARSSVKGREAVIHFDWLNVIGSN